MASLSEAFDLIASAETLEQRVAHAAAELSYLPGFDDEKAWLAIALDRAQKARAALPEDTLARALRLPELADMRAEHAKSLQNAAVDALEKLHGSITHAGGPRSPLLEALYYKLKIPALRKCDHGEFAAFWSDFQGRLGASYPKRMLANEEYGIVLPSIAALRAAVTTFLNVFDDATLSEEEAETLKRDLEGAAGKLEIPFRQARLLAQAALAPMKELLDASGLVAKKRKKGDDEDTHAILEQDPPDPNVPTPEEREELAAVHAAAD